MPKRPVVIWLGEEKFDVRKIWAKLSRFWSGPSEIEVEGEEMGMFVYGHESRTVSFTGIFRPFLVFVDLCLMLTT